jgi:hypothetical protein
MEDLKKFIKDKKPTLSTTSITTYASILKNLYTKIFDNDKINFDNFNDQNKIINYLENVEPNKRKTILSALILISTDNKKYRNLMLSDIESYNNNINKQEKSETQKENWTNKEEITNILNNLEKNSKLLYKKSSLTINDLQEIQNYIILCLLGGIYISPRRSKDFTEFKIRGTIDKTKDNYDLQIRFNFDSDINNPIDESMNIDKILYRILLGYYFVKIENVTYKIIYPSMKLKYESEILYDSIIEDNKFFQTGTNNADSITGKYDSFYFVYLNFNFREKRFYFRN